jgi:two-component system chemotaxis response regulator CheY
MKLLIVDDSKYVRVTLRRFFAEVPNIEIVEATNGIEALEYHRSFKPDIIFMDVTMPHLDGLATLKTIRIIDREVNVIMVTALGGQQYLREECLAYGALDVLTKPVMEEQVLQAFMTAVNRLPAGLSA